MASYHPEQDAGLAFTLDQKLTPENCARMASSGDFPLYNAPLANVRFVEFEP
tara:strand:- start:417 stop:572 length:156 start_codon:yes stop_codon:yes gene_type:complete